MKQRTLRLTVLPIGLLLLSIGLGEGSGKPGDLAGASRSASQEVFKSDVDVIVRFEPNQGSRLGAVSAKRFAGPELSSRTRATMTSLGAKVTRSWFNGRLALVSFHGHADISEALDRLRAESQVKYAVPNYWLSPAEYIPNDPEFGSQWGLENDDDVDIDAPLAWDQTTGNSTTVVAVMDSGVDYTHPDLYLAIALNAAEIPPSLLSQIVDTNSDGQIDFYDLNSLDESGGVALDSQGNGFNEGLATDLNGNGFIDAGDLMATPWMDGQDNDGNGSVDDLTGWDHLSNSSDPIDTFGHGTHIAGIIAARGDNGLGIAGVNWQARILPEKFSSSGGGWTSDAIQAIEHAVTLGADVINASWGVFVHDPALEDAIRWAGENGVVFVAAAGNHSSNNDGSNPYYPASYELPNLISVGSVDPDGNLSDFSNYGVSTVHLAAPGRDILSLSLGSGYQLWSGTSMATPHVAGVVSLLAGLYPEVSPEWLVESTLATAKPLPDLMGMVSTGGIVDAFVAVNVPNEGGPRVLSSSPTGDVSTSIDRVTLTFDRPIAPSSFSTEDVSIDGPLGSVDPSQINRLTDYVFEVIFPLQEALGEYRLQVGPDIADTIGFVMDQDGDGTPGEPLEDRFDTTFRLQQILIVDDGDAGFTATSGWTTYVGAGAQGDFAYKGVGSGAETASWTFTGLSPGQYRISATWQAYSNRVTDAPYTVLDGSSVMGTVLVDQRQSPAGFLEDGSWWQDLGGAYDVVTGSLTVELSDSAGPSGSVLIADAVRLERLGDIPSGPEIQVLLDGANVQDGVGAVDYGTTLVGLPVAGVFTVRNDGSEDLVLGAITVPTGFSLIQDFGQTTLGPGQATSFAVELEAATEGVFAGSISFGSNDADENPFDFVVSGTVSIEVISEILIVDDGDAGFTATSGWTTYVGAGAQGDFAYKGAGSGAETASWTFTGLAPGQYRVSATWQAYSNRVTDAPYTVLDGSSVMGTVLVNQRESPAGFLEDGSWWQDLGGAYDVVTGSLTVELNDSAGPSGSYLVADAVRLERLGDIPSGPEIQVLLDAADVQDGVGSVDYGTTLVGLPVAGVFTVRNAGSEDLVLGAITVPTGFSLIQDFGQTTLGPGQATSFAVELEAATEGVFAGSISFGSNDADENPFDFVVSGTVSVEVISEILIVDDGDAGFTATSGWTTYVGAGAQGDFAYKGAGSGAETASWTFTGLAPGQYRVSATWQAYSNRVTDAPYTVLDGSSVMGTVLVNQRESPAGFLEDGSWWQDLGGAYDVVTGSLTVELNDSAGPSGSYLVADAVRLERLGDIPSGPEIQVLLDAADVQDGVGSVDYGTTLVGLPVAGVFTVRNAGSEDLVLGAITVPTGFSLIQDFGQTTLGPGQATSFAVELEAATEGIFTGSISFGSNDADENPFDFVVSGTVSVEVISEILIVDDGDAGFTATSGWTTYVGAGAQGDFAYKGVGSGAETASWTFTGLAPGQYRVSATWQAYSNRVTDAPYTVLDGSSVMGTVLVNQRESPAGFLEDGSWWQDLGGAYDVVTGSLTVELNDSAGPSGSYLVADAVRLERLGDLPSN